jgi:hypothetical protein
MTTFRVGQDVAVVEHDDATRKPREGGQVWAASVTSLSGPYVRANVEGHGLVTFWLESGWTAWTGGFGWRLVPVCERCEDPILGEPVIHPAGPGPGHIYCGSDCEDDAAVAWHEMHYREA